MFNRKPTFVLLRAEALSEGQINAALAVAEDNALWRAVHQLISTAEANANRNAQDGMDPVSVMAGYVGGAAHLRMLRDELNDRREEGLKLLGERRTQPEGWEESYH